MSVCSGQKVSSVILHQFHDTLAILRSLSYHIILSFLIKFFSLMEISTSVTVSVTSLKTVVNVMHQIIVYLSATMCYCVFIDKTVLISKE